MMLTDASLQLPGRTTNIFCSATADERVHDHILAVDRQLVYVVEADRQSSCAERFESGRWERSLERVVDASVDYASSLVTSERETEKYWLPFSFHNRVR